MLETAPKKNIRELPMKKATTVTIRPIFGVLANLAKFGVAVPPETKLPITRPAPAMIPRSFVPWANWAIRVESPLLTAMIMATVPRMATAGTAM